MTENTTNKKEPVGLTISYDGPLFDLDGDARDEASERLEAWPLPDAKDRFHEDPSLNVVGMLDDALATGVIVAPPGLEAMFVNDDSAANPGVICNVWIVGRGCALSDGWHEIGGYLFDASGATAALVDCGRVDYALGEALYHLNAPLRAISEDPR